MLPAPICMPRTTWQCFCPGVHVTPAQNTGEYWWMALAIGSQCALGLLVARGSTTRGLFERENPVKEDTPESALHLTVRVSFFPLRPWINLGTSSQSMELPLRSTLMKSRE